MDWRKILNKIIFSNAKKNYDKNFEYLVMIFLDPSFAEDIVVMICKWYFCYDVNALPLDCAKRNFYCSDSDHLIKFDWDSWSSCLEAVSCHNIRWNCNLNLMVCSLPGESKYIYLCLKNTHKAWVRLLTDR